MRWGNVWSLGSRTRVRRKSAERPLNGRALTQRRLIDRDADERRPDGHDAVGCSATLRKAATYARDAGAADVAVAGARVNKSDLVDSIENAIEQNQGGVPL